MFCIHYFVEDEHLIPKQKNILQAPHFFPSLISNEDP